jgi:aminopeptidase N
MKKTGLFLLLLLAQVGMAQHNLCSAAKRASMGGRLHVQAREAALTALTSHELKYDVKFVHLSVNVERNTTYISGNVKTVATVTVLPMDTFMTLLHQNHTIDSLRFNGALLPVIRQDSMVKVKMPTPLPVGTSFTVLVYYKGTPPIGGSAIGSGFSSGSSTQFTNTATWSLSESLVAYHWWPCKQILTDKIDSSWVFITTDSTNKAGSNGLLKNVVVVGSKKRYEWKSHSPIAYYLISVAVAKYKEYNLYAHPLYLPNDSILIQNYIYDGAINNGIWISQQKTVLDKMPQVLEFECKAYGMYPFYKEKYGHCMAPFGGGMEHQTMTSLGFFDYYVDAHELGHQWFGDNVTCKSWGDIWINEGFAAYTEHLVAEHLDPANFMTNLAAAHTDVMSLPGGSVFFTGHDTVDANIIFDQRLTYDKGGSIIRSLQFLTNSDTLWFHTLRSFQNTFKNSTASVVDFKNYYQTQTGINATQFFNQWYYGQGYPTFSVTYNYDGSSCFIKSVQTVSMPSGTPLFITPMQYKIVRAGHADTTILVMHTQATEIYVIALTGTVTSVSCDPNNWIINNTYGPARDPSLGVAQPVDGIATIDKDFSTITIGPNPTKGVFTIGNTANLTGKITVFDLGGKQLLEKALARDASVDLENYKDGLYFVKIYDAEGKEKYVQKIIKQ